MKKYLLLISTMLAVNIAGIAKAEISCTNIPSTKCADMGYTQTTSQCSGRQMLKCPFDDSKVWCKIAQPVNCVVGDILFNDKKCYRDLDALPSGKTAVAVVFDATNKLAIDLVTSSQGSILSTNQDVWSTYNGIPYVSDSKLLYTSGGSVVATSGLATTQAMSGYCGYEEMTITRLGHTTTYNKVRGCKIPNISVLPDADDNNTSLETFRTTRSTLSNQQGWVDTRGFAYAHNKKAANNSANILANPAKYCFDKNNFDCCVLGTCNNVQSQHCPDTQTMSVSPWYLPTIGDLVILHDNLEAVQSGFARAAEYGYTTNNFSGVTHSSSLAYTLDGDRESTSPRNYIYSWAALLTADWVNATSTGSFIPDRSFVYTFDHKTRCAIHYGSSWTVPNIYYSSHYAQH